MQVEGGVQVLFIHHAVKIRYELLLQVRCGAVGSAISDLYWGRGVGVRFIDTVGLCAIIEKGWARSQVG